MKCDLCKQNEAEVAVKQAIDGQERELLVCPDCARRAAGSLVGSLVELLLGAAVDLHLPARDDPACPGCGLARSAFRKSGRLGCARCYEAFARELAPMLRDMQGGERHVGKFPARERLGRDLAELNRALKEAVREQRFEEAAILRDRIRAAAAGGNRAVA